VRPRLEPTAEITALGTVRGLDTTLVPARGYPLELIPPVPLPRKLNRALLRTPGRLRDAARQRFGLRPDGPVLTPRPTS
jgi:UDP-N-acetylglucosamine--N-acetylmuramyl-(pentapeptide) pyrophosphoryl-undecaprenol N-acetylglucosamine transferase